MKDCIEITNVDLTKFVQKVYDLSKPQGMGYLQYIPGPLTNQEAEDIVNKQLESTKSSPMIQGYKAIMSLDYVNGRSCKMTIFKTEDEKLWIRNPWFDHTDNLLEMLLSGFNIKLEKRNVHSPACVCIDCETGEDDLSSCNDYYGFDY